MNEYVEKAKELRRNCYHAATCGMCSDLAKEVCYDLCEFDNKTLAELEPEHIADYLRKWHPNEV